MPSVLVVSHVAFANELFDVIKGHLRQMGLACQKVTSQKETKL